jgi:hypothetical protein
MFNVHTAEHSVIFVLYFPAILASLFVSQLPNAGFWSTLKPIVFFTAKGAHAWILRAVTMENKKSYL